MPSPTVVIPPFARLSERARIVVIADPLRQAHALRRLRHYLSGRPLQIVEAGDLAGALPMLQAGPGDLLVVLSEPGISPLDGLGVSRQVELPAADAFAIRTAQWHGQPWLILMGGGRPGLIHAVDELGTRHLIARDDTLELPALDLRRTAALPYRLLWTWDHSTNWYLEQVGIQEIGALNYYSKPRSGFLEDYCRLVDFMSLHRIGGVTIYGFLRDNHGGVEAAQELCRYATERGVRILPGVGINAYGGVYWEGDHPYNLTHWLRRHPELRAVFDRPVAFHIPDMPELWFPETHYTDAACPSKPENARYHEEAIQWLAETFDIGGINFETGDYGVCRCDDCRARRSDDATWSHRDMEMLYPRLFAAARRGRPDMWLVCEAYWDNLLDLDKLAPLAGLPEDTIYQFCINRSYWPRVRDSLTRAHVERLPRPHNVVRTHMGSQWNHERHELVADRFADLMQRMHRTGMEGATIFGEVSAFSTVNEINYLAFARFGYQADLTWEQFVTDDLAPLLGGEEAAQRYLAHLRVPSEEKALRAALGEAGELVAARSGEARRRWVWLQNRLYQKLMMLNSRV